MPQTAKIVALPGDGVGPDVLAAGLKVLDAAAEAYGLGVDVQTVGCGAQHYQRHGAEWEEGGLEACREADASLLGAVGWPGVSLPNGDIAGAGVVFGLRFGLDLYANVRPCKLYEGVPHRIGDRFTQIWRPDEVDLVLLRENTEGSYTPTRGTLSRADVDEMAIDTRVITRKGSLRIHEKAFEIAAGRPDSSVTCIDKANVRAGCRLFRACFNEVAANHPDIPTGTQYVDAFTQALMRDPAAFDVGVAPNMLGDIVTDLAAVLQGGMGMAASGNIGDHHAVFEPVHGSAPDIAGQNAANPYAMVQCIQMMLNHLAPTHGARYADAAADVEAALRSAIQGGALTPDLGGSATTTAAADAVVAALRAEA
ncbi:MAG: isocitrate/isopropylmalate dehydrogenase family protein [Thermoplasmatota archaeon]